MDDYESDGGGGGGEGSVTRGRGERGEPSTSGQPLFLRKTYHMLETCDQNIASWSADGTSFLVKNTEAFPSVLPHYFNHNNISSFVRQLNFYGFKKISKLNPQYIANKIWEFKHERFLRGRPDLLASIKRATHGTNDQEVAHLKDEVGHLKTKIYEMSTSIDKLTTLVNDLMLDKWERDTLKQQQQRVLPQNQSVNGAPAGSSLPAPLRRQNQDVEKTDGLVPIKSEFPEHFGRGGMLDDVLTNNGGLTFDENGTLIVGSETPFNPFNDLDTMAISPPQSPRSTTPPPVRTVAVVPRVGGGLQQMQQQQVSGTVKSEEDVAALQQTLLNLSPEQQHKLVETLKESLASNASSSTSSSSSSSSFPTTSGAAALANNEGASTSSSSSSSSSPVSMPLASAALGAFLTKYAETRRLEEIPMKPRPAPDTRKAIRSQG